MALTIEELRKAADGAMYTAPARICVTADDELCEETDPRAARLLVGKGCQIPARVAAHYGLIEMGDVHEALEEAGQALDERLGAPVAEEPPAAAEDDGEGAEGGQASEDGAEGGDEPETLESLTVAVLLEHAEMLGLHIASRATKREIIAAIEEASAASANADEQ